MARHNKITGAQQTAILGSLLADIPPKAVAFEHGVAPATISRIQAQHALRPMLVLPAERAQLLALRGKRS